MGSAPVDYILSILHGNRLKVKVIFLSRLLIGRNLAGRLISPLWGISVKASVAIRALTQTDVCNHAPESSRVLNDGPAVGGIIFDSELDLLSEGRKAT